MGINKDLGLPFGDGMEKIVIAFDVDGTLIDSDENVYEHISMLMFVFYTYFKNIRILVWSGGGKQYAETITRRLGLDKYVWRFASKLEYAEIKRGRIIIAIDDVQDTRLGDINLIVRNK